VISVVIPVRDEERSVALLVDELDSALQPLGHEWEAIFVDDGSADGTYAALTRLHAARDDVRVVRLRRNFGKAAALGVGFAQAHGDVIVTLDGDLQDDPAEIPHLLAKLDEGFDLVLAHHRGFRIAELPVNHRPRGHGRSRYGMERYLRGFLDLLTVSFIGRYRHRPLHLFGGLGLTLSVAGTGILVYLTIDKLLGHAIGQRPLLILGVLLVVVGLQVFSLGLITELITSHHEERASERERAEALVEEILT
jgi:glycosyltransferase involved in cell wall biosynthesis